MILPIKDIDKWDGQLDSLLKEAAHDPGIRPAFYMQLLNSVIFTLGEVAHAGKNLSLIQKQTSTGRMYIPIFTARNHIYSLQGSTCQEGILGLYGSTVFEIAKDLNCSIIINYGQHYGKEFSIEEIHALLTEKHSIIQEEPQPQFIVYPFRKAPTQICNALSSWFSENLVVKAAYLVKINEHSNTAAQPETLLHVLINSESPLADVEKVLDGVEIVIGELSISTREKLGRIHINAGETFDFINKLSDKEKSAIKPIYLQHKPSKKSFFIKAPFGKKH